jgi:hypothetical protein
MTLVKITEHYRQYWDRTEECMIYVDNETGVESYKEPKE